MPRKQPNLSEMLTTSLLEKDVAKVDLLARARDIDRSTVMRMLLKDVVHGYRPKLAEVEPGDKFVFCRISQTEAQTLDLVCTEMGTTRPKLMRALLDEFLAGHLPSSLRTSGTLAAGEGE